MSNQGLSKGAKQFIGCSLGCLLLLIAGAVITVLVARQAGRFLMEKQREQAAQQQVEHEAMMEGFRALGFINRVEGQTISIEEDITEPVIYDAQVVKIWGDCTTNLCVLAQVCEIYGTVEGRLYFRGQTLTIQPNAVIKNGLDVEAQVVKRKGTVHGTITGKYQVFED